MVHEIGDDLAIMESVRDTPREPGLLERKKERKKERKNTEEAGRAKKSNQLLRHIDIHTLSQFSSRTI